MRFECRIFWNSYTAGYSNFHTLLVGMHFWKVFSSRPCDQIHEIEIQFPPDISVDSVSPFPSVSTHTHTHTHSSVENNWTQWFCSHPNKARRPSFASLELESTLCTFWPLMNKIKSKKIFVVVGLAIIIDNYPLLSVPPRSDHWKDVIVCILNDFLHVDFVLTTDFETDLFFTSVCFLSDVCSRSRRLIFLHFTLCAFSNGFVNGKKLNRMHTVICPQKDHVCTKSKSFSIDLFWKRNEQNVASF